MNASSPAADPEFAACIGLDWADKKHAWSLQIAGSERVERGEVENTPEAIDVWISECTQRFQGRPLAVALEQSRGSVIARLSKYANLVLFPINPRTSSDYRSCFRLAGAKSDPSDADLLLELVTRHRDRLRQLNPDSEATRMLRVLTEQRRNLIDQQTTFTNQLTDVLKQIFPQALQWLDRLYTAMACEFLERWPTLQSLRRVRPETLRRFFHQHNSRSPERIEERLKELAGAVVATEDRALLEPGTLMIRCLTKQLAQLRGSIAEFDAKIEETARAHPDFALIDSFPGAGVVMAPRLLATLGTNRDRFASASELQCFTGIAPVTVASGRQKWIHWRWACSRFDRQTIHEWAGHSRKKCQWAQEYYEAQRARGKGHHAAIRALGYKWLRILYRCWKDRKPYQETHYLASRGKFQKASKETSGKPVEIQWESCGTFFTPSAFSS